MRWYIGRLAQVLPGTELSPEQRAEMHSELTRSHRTAREKAILRVVERGVLEGHNLLSAPLRGQEVDLEDVITAIKTERCIPTSERDLGYTYLESLLANVISDQFRPHEVNEARRVFGLPPK